MLANKQIRENQHAAQQEKQRQILVKDSGTNPADSEIAVGYLMSMQHRKTNAW